MTTGVVQEGDAASGQPQYLTRLASKHHMSKREGDNNAELQPAAKAARATPKMEVPLQHLQHVVCGRASDPEPIDLAWVRPWLGASDNCFKCKMCSEYCDVGYEVEFQ